MPSVRNPELLGELLPGRWAVKASNLPAWLMAEQPDAVYEFEHAAAEPLELRECVEFRSASGETVDLRGTDRWLGDAFAWRGVKPAARLFGKRWSVWGAGEVIALHFESRRARSSGIDVLVREGVERAELRAEVAREPDRFGLDLESFASLTWFEHLPGR